MQLHRPDIIAIRKPAKMPLNNFAKTPGFRFWQKPGGIMAEKLV